MKFNQLQNNFTSGELSEYLVGRVDLEEYKNGLQTCSNFIPQKQGGVRFRSGTQFVKMVENASSPVERMLIPFISDTDSYTIAISWVMTGTLNNDVKIYNKNGTACTITDNVNGYIFNKLPYYNASWSGSWASNTATATNLHYAQSGDVLILCSPNGDLAPILIARTGAFAFSINHLLGYREESIFGTDPKQLALRTPYSDTNLSGTTITPSATTGAGITLTASSATFDATMIGRNVRITHGSTTGVAVITAYTSTTVVTATVIVNFGSATGSSNWKLSSWYKGYYPKSVCFFEQRLCFGGNNRSPDSIWTSEQGDIFQFMQTRLAQDSSTDSSGLGFFGSATVADPFNFTIYSQTGSAIKFIVGTESLWAGTSSGVFEISGGSEQSLSISSIFIKKTSYVAASFVMPKIIEGGFAFVSSDQKKVYVVKIGEKTPVDISILFDEKVLKEQATDDTDYNSNIYAIEWNPNESILWVASGTAGSEYLQNDLFGVVIDFQSKTVSWFRSPLAVVDSAKPKILGVISIPNENHFCTYFLILRSFASYSDQVTIEMMAPRDVLFYAFTRNEECYLDRAEVGVASSTVSVNFPNGMVVTATSDGETLGTYTVAGGQVDLSPLSPSGNIVIGLPYEGEIKTMPFEAGQTFGQAQGLPRRVHEAIFRVYKSRGGTYYANENNSFDLIKDSLLTNNVYSGEIKQSINASPHDVTLTIKQEEPAPMHILWAMLRGVTYDG